MASEVLVPSSPAEAVELFGDGAATTVIGGGTVVVADISYGRLDPGRVLLLSNAGLDGVSVDGETVTIGATTPINALLALEEHSAALAACARNLADYEIRGQGTVGGNLCVGAGHDAPRGDLQGCLLALDARVRSAGADGERTEPLEDFLAHRHERLVLDVSFERPAASAFAALEYPHTHEYTVIAVSGARSADGTTRLAATGVAGPGARLRSAEALASDPAAAGAAAVGDVTFADDALASAWYREQTLPVLVRRVLTQLEESS
jgi:carbon-monoxide dehydrogenase medium subunit